MKRLEVRGSKMTADSSTFIGFILTNLDVFPDAYFDSDGDYRFTCFVDRLRREDVSALRDFIEDSEFGAMRLSTEAENEEAKQPEEPFNEEAKYPAVPCDEDAKSPTEACNDEADQTTESCNDEALQPAETCNNEDTQSTEIVSKSQEGEKPSEEKDKRDVKKFKKAGKKIGSRRSRRTRAVPGTKKYRNKQVDEFLKKIPSHDIETICNEWCKRSAVSEEHQELVKKCFVDGYSKFRTLAKWEHMLGKGSHVKEKTILNQYTKQGQWDGRFTTMMSEIFRRVKKAEMDAKSNMDRAKRDELKDKITKFMVDTFKNELPLSDNEIEFIVLLYEDEKIDGESAEFNLNRFLNEMASSERYKKFVVPRKYYIEIGDKVSEYVRDVWGSMNLISFINKLRKELK